MNKTEEYPQQRRAKNFRVLEGKHRELPFSHEAEEYLISCCLLDGVDVVNRAYRGGIRGGSFYVTAHGIIFEHLQAMVAKGIPIDVSTCAEELKKSQQFDLVGGYSFLTQVSSKIPTTAQATYFIETVFALSMRRAQIRDCEHALEECHESKDELEELLARQALQLQRRADYVSRRKTKPLRERMSQRLEQTLAAAAGNVDRSRWIHTGFPGLDAAIGPWDVRREHWYNIIAGPPGGGKSSFMRHIALHNVVAREKRFAIFLLETGLMWTESAAATLADVPLREIIEGTAPQDMVDRYATEYRALMAIAEDRLFVFDDIYFVEDIERKVRELDRTLRDKELAAAAQILDPDQRAKAEASAHGLDGVVIDYLQLVPTRQNFRGQREQVVSHVSREMKLMAKRLDVPFFVGAQINRAGREDSSKPPTLAALRESGAIEQDADSVNFVHTPPTNKAGVEQNGTQSTDEVEIVQRKRRNGEAGVAHGLLFHKARTRYEEPHNERSVKPGTPKRAGGYKRPEDEL